jgi:sn-glycerol 3-phosphate transport system substrate-binding protein
MSGGSAKIFDTMIEKFNASQDKVEVVGTYQGDYFSSIANAINAISSGNGPDLIQTGSDQVRLLSDEKGIVANLKSYMTKDSGVWYEDFTEGFIKPYVSDNGNMIAALPMGCSTPVMYTNTTLMKKAGISSVPTTWDELEADCQKLAEGKYCDYGFSQPRAVWYFWTIIPNYSGQDIFSADGQKVACRDGGIAAYTFLQNMVKKNYYYPTPAADGNTIVQQMMQTGKLCFYVTSIGSLGTMEKVAKEGQWDLAVTNIPGKAASSVPSGGNSLVMLESSKHKDAVWQFIKWLYTSEDGVAAFDAGTGYLACTNTLKNAKVVQDKIKADKNYAAAYEYTKNINNNHIITGESDMSTDVVTFMDAVFFDQKDVTAEWDKLEKIMNDKLKEHSTK